jgi:hypothetical protein
MGDVAKWSFNEVEVELYLVHDSTCRGCNPWFSCGGCSAALLHKLNGGIVQMQQ